MTVKLMILIELPKCCSILPPQGMRAASNRGTLSNANAQPVADSITGSLFTLIGNFAMSVKANTKSSRSGSIGLLHQTSKNVGYTLHADLIL